MFGLRTSPINVSNLHSITKQRCFSQRPPFDPLRILFCGADEFSLYSLRAVKSLQTERPQWIESIDVVCRPDKRVGRGLKKIQEVPIKAVARELRLPVHGLDTFTGWTPPTPINLVVAVSFGLLVPARILNGAKFGGLNVHPSLLPDLRGPAPIQHALLKGRKWTGVTVQTMHPTCFDHGSLLAQQTKSISEIDTMSSLIEELGNAGANLLIHAILEGLFVSGTSLASPEHIKNLTPDVIEHAPKIAPEDRKIDWNTWTADRVLRYDRTLGKLWDEQTYSLCQNSTETKRVIFDGPWSEVLPPEECQEQKSGHTWLYPAPGSHRPLLALRTADGQLLTPTSATIEGQPKGKGLTTLAAGDAFRNP